MDNKEQWHLDKRLNLGHIITTLSVAAGLLIWALDIENRIASQEIKIDHNTDKIIKSEERSNKSLERVYDLIDKVNDKLDRLIERR